MSGSTGSSRRTWARAAAAERAVEAGALVDGVARAKSYRLEGGEEIELPAAEPEPVVAPPAPPRSSSRTSTCWSIDKPAGLVVHPGAGHRTGTLVDALAGKIAGGEPGRPGIVHRLDRDTSGLMVAARTQEAYELLTGLVREHALERTYTRARQGTAAFPHRADRGADRPRPRRPDARLARHRLAARRGHALRGRLELWPGHALLRVHAGDGADAPDPRAPRRDRPARRRRSGLRRAPSRRSGGSSCTPRSSPSRIPSQRGADRDPVGAACPISTASSLVSAPPDGRGYHAQRPRSLRPAGTPRVDGGRQLIRLPPRASPEHRNPKPRKGLSCPSFP